MLRLLLKLGAAACVVLFATLFFRACSVGREPPTAKLLHLPKIDPEAAALRLSRLLAVPTISRNIENEIDAEPFVELQRRMQENYPKLFVSLDRRSFGASVVFRWKGKSETKTPLLMLAHQDVVPVENEKDWIHPPFEGEIADGFIWGRGALDDKSSMAAMLEAAELMITVGERPERTVYFAFGHDEEIGGNQGAKVMAKYFADNKIHFAATLDEGPMIERGMMPGLAQPVAKIGLAEKGYVNIELRTEGEGGHSSMPPEQTTVGLLAKAIAAVEAAPMPVRFSEPMRAQLAFLAPEMPFGSRLAFANLWLFEPMMLSRMSRGNAANALVRTTLAPTVFEGSIRENVLAKRARAVLNVRLLPGDTIESAVAYVKSVVADSRVGVTPMMLVTSEASETSRTTSAAFSRVEAAYHLIYPQAVVAPALVTIATDSRHYARISDDIYRLLPLPADNEDLKRLHGPNERISLEGYATMIQFYAQYLGMKEPE